MPTLPKSRKRPWIKSPEYNKMQGQGRKSENQWFYKSKAWRSIRKSHLMKEPFCRECAKNGRTTAAIIVDHIKPINPVNLYDLQGGKYGDPFAEDNLQSLCNSCHAKKSGKERHLK